MEIHQPDPIRVVHLNEYLLKHLNKYITADKEEAGGHLCDIDVVMACLDLLSSAILTAEKEYTNSAEENLLFREALVNLFKMQLEQMPTYDYVEKQQENNDDEWEFPFSDN